ncbi:MAG: M14 family metallopeptidase [Kiloniellales bacterium]|nr:M14 family metallopeptidase [Kiloniellales bacterium]
MTRSIEEISLPGSTPGTARRVMLRRYGAAGARPRAYLQASVHADETPALLVAHHLARLLDAAAAAGEITGEIVLVPYANPLGLGNVVNAYHLGRYELGGAGNFNRNWPDLLAPVADKVAGKLTDNGEANVALIRAAMAEVVAALPAASEIQGLRRVLAREACQSDLVLDLHCDDDALMHLFIIPALWPAAADLAAELECRAVMTSDPAGGDPFDEAFSSVWTRLAERFPDHPIPQGCFSATVELRGQADVADALAAADAAALFRVLQRRGVIAGDPGPIPAALCTATRLDAADSVKAPAAGVLSYTAALGDQVSAGQMIAELIDPAAEDPAKGRQPIVTRASGLLLSRRLLKYVTPGTTVAKVVGDQPLGHREGGYLLED